ncbi:MAG: endolytic transglycosylase MltG [Methyloprofundus sp.]|nr:endolytic transglycosylase MltG [Methyloprofundus sp.]
MLRRLFATFLLIAVLTFGWLWSEYRAFLDRPIVTEKRIVLEVVRGSSLKSIITRLNYQVPKIVLDYIWFKVLAHQEGLAVKLQAGEYELAVGIKPLEFLQQLSKGKVMQHSLTFPEGWTFKQIRQTLTLNKYLKHSIENLTDVEVLRKLGSKEIHAEGFFFPDTYYFEKNTSDLVVLQKAYKKMQLVLHAQWKNRADKLILKTPYEALILASIVEKETGVASERPVIAGVFTRRLKIGMRLQTDPTVIYGMGENYDGNIRRKDLKTLTAYNTYKIKGLPPTPIAMPGKEAIHAVLHPAKGNSLYFVANGDGSHVFSATLREHNNAVNNYQRKRR